MYPRSKLMSKTQNCCNEFMHKRIPITKWLPEYNKDKALADFIAGFTVFLIVLPQGLAYAALAGIDAKYGLYSSFMGCFVYLIFGSRKEITLGPTLLLALMTCTQPQKIDLYIILTFFTGVIQLIIGLFNLGVLISFISIPVIVGFTSAASVIIATSQLKELLGLEFESESFFNTVQQIYTNLPKATLADSVMGISCIVVLLSFRKLKDVELSSQNCMKKAFWWLSTLRNALVVALCLVISLIWDSFIGFRSPFKLIYIYYPDYPGWNMPPFHTYELGNYVSFWTLIWKLGPSIILVPIIAVAGNMAVAKAFANGDSVDDTQEILTTSLANILGSFLGAMPITASFSRSSVNHASGVATQFGSLYTGVLVLLAIYFISPFFYYIPKAALAAVVICSAIRMVECKISSLTQMCRSRRSDVLLTAATFSLCLAGGVELGICAGVALNLAMLLYHSARPHLRADTVTIASGFTYLRITVGSLYFPGVEYIRQYVERAAKKQGDCTMPVVIDCRCVLGSDFTAMKGMCELSDSLSARGQPLLLLSLQDSVASMIAHDGSSPLIVTPNQLEQTLKELSKQMALGTKSDEKHNITPPPSYESLKQLDETEEVSEVVITSAGKSILN